MKKGISSKGKRFAFYSDPAVERIILRVRQETGLSDSKIINIGVFKGWPKHHGKKDDLCVPALINGKK